MKSINNFIIEKLNKINSKNSKSYNNEIDEMFDMVDDSGYEWTENSWMEVDTCKEELIKLVDKNFYQTEEPKKRMKLFFKDTYKYYLNNCSEYDEKNKYYTYYRKMEFIKKYGFNKAIYSSIEQGYWHYMYFIVKEYLKMI